MSFLVYGLRVTGDREVRYIGFTGHDAATRLKGHYSNAKLYGARPTVGLAGWLLDNEGNVEAVELARAGGKAAIRIAERAAVEFCVALNHRLFNTWLVPAEHRKHWRRERWQQFQQQRAA